MVGQHMEGVDNLYLILFLICLGFAAFFCATETAFISLQKLRLKHLVRINHPEVWRVARIVEHPEKFLATVLLGINFFETAVAVLGTIIAVSLWRENIGVVIATVAITILTLVFAEVIPKSIGARYGEKIALTFARPIEFISVLLFPFVYILSHLGLRFTKLGGKATETEPLLSEAEILTAISVGEAEGVVAEEEAEMVHKVFKFGDRPVREAMTPRTEIAWVEEGTRLADFLDIYRDSPHSRFPVFKESTDNVVGILSIKDVLMAEATDSLSRQDVIDSLVRPAYFVPETKRLGELLGEMRDNNYHVALIVDEFGGVAGIITLDQLVEEIVGSIGDELAGKGEEFVAIDANTFEVEGGLRVEEANEELGLGLPTGDYETVAGFILFHLGHIPKPGGQLKYKNLKLAITEMRGMKIEKILITRESDATTTTPQVQPGGGG